MTKSEIDRLGDRLKAEHAREDDLRLLDVYRDSFQEAYAYVLGILRDTLGLAPSGREAKTTASIIAKLLREKTRLSRMQDIAGIRVIAANVTAQDQVVASLRKQFADIKIVDRRERPSHGYRAVHAIVSTHGKQVEIQVRTELQHRWAELSEKRSDSSGLAVKYGGGPPKTRELLLELSGMVSTLESLEPSLSGDGLEDLKRRIMKVLENAAGIS